MDEQSAIVIGSLIGSGAASIGVVVVVGVKVWQALSKLLPPIGRVAASVDEALGSEDDLIISGIDTPEPRRRRKTGSFQVMVREELEEHDRRLDRRFDRIEATVDGLAVGFKALQTSQSKQAEILGRLANGHETVMARTAAHSAELALARADGSMTAGRLNGGDR